MTSTSSATDPPAGTFQQSHNEEAKSLLDKKDQQEVPNSFSSENMSSRDSEYTALNLSSAPVVEQKRGKPHRPSLLFFHFAFKGLATVLYLFAGLLGLPFISTFVFVVILLSVDFWLVKNLSGRLLAGLRWWSVTEEDTGKMVWRFEAWTQEERQIAYASQVNLFWAGLIVQQAFWGLLFCSAMFSLKLGWFVITVIACALNGSNLYGYVRCRMQRQNQNNAGLWSRFTDSLGALFRISGGSYFRGNPGN